MPNLRIAVADDERDMRDYLRWVLERLGHTVLGPVDNGRALVDLCREEAVDLVITDIRMPEMNGDVALKHIQAIRQTPYIVISAFGSPEALSDAMEGEWIYLNKPVGKRDLQEAIARLMPQEGPAGTPE